MDKDCDAFFLECSTIYGFKQQALKVFNVFNFHFLRWFLSVLLEIFADLMSSKWQILQIFQNNACGIVPNLKDLIVVENNFKKPLVLIMANLIYVSVY